jgi:hypothetical protein
MLKDSDGLLGSSQTNYRVFTVLKYLVYALLSFNVYLFLQEETQALEHTFVDGFEFSQLIQVFAATIDTTAWVILLLLFELETSVLDDNRIHGVTKWSLHGIRGLCYVAIVWAFTGYCSELATVYSVVPLVAPDLCALLPADLSLLLSLDDYVPLDGENCAAFNGPYYRLEGFGILAPEDNLSAARWLAWTDVINSGDWILIVILLEIEVRLQLRGDLSDAIMSVTKYIKFTLYGSLFVAAAYWGYAGTFLDFWDASLWLFAFIFIELNVFEWQHETKQQALAAD